MAFKTDLEAVILASLEDGSLHGYEISKRIGARSEGILKVGEGRLYPALHSLEERGLVRADWTHQEGKPSKKVYTLTETGRGCLAEKRKAWDKFVAGIGAALSMPLEGHHG